MLGWTATGAEWTKLLEADATRRMCQIIHMQHLGLTVVPKLVQYSMCATVLSVEPVT